MQIIKSVFNRQNNRAAKTLQLLWAAKKEKLFWLLVGMSPLVVQAAPLELRHDPLFLLNPMEANIFYMLDDSGSMDMEYLIGPEYYYKAYWANDNNFIHESGGRWLGKGDLSDETYYSYIFENIDSVRNNSHPGGYGKSLEMYPDALKFDWRSVSSQFNRIYYDPAVTYSPWVGYPPANFNSVKSNPVPGNPGYTSTRDLGVSGFTFEVATDNRGYTGSDPAPSRAVEVSNGKVDLWDDHRRFFINGTRFTVTDVTYDVSVFTNCSHADVTAGPIPYAGCLGAKESTSSPATPLSFTGRTLAEEQQNIANWYQYHRRRMLSAKYMVSTLTTEYANFRYGLGYLNSREFIEMPAAGTDFISHNGTLVESLFSFQQGKLSTPLRGALKRVGDYYSGGLPGKPSPINSACQHNFALLFSDGFWRGGNPNIGSPADKDGDGYENTLADVAKHFYDLDLRTDLANKVPTVYNESGDVVDDNNKQHMTTYTVAFGIQGHFTDANQDGLPDEISPVLESSDWGNPYLGDEIPVKVDDMWHAAFNSKGSFLSDSSPADLLKKLQGALSEIGTRTGSNASISVSGSVLSTDTLLMQTEFSLLERTGNLTAYNFDLDTRELGSAAKWNAASSLKRRDANSREIITLDTVNDKQVPFRWNKLNADQKTQLNNEENVLKYIRGDDTLEEPLGPYRKRNGHLLGPIVHSPALYVSNPSRTYPIAWGDGTETDYKLFKEGFVTSPRKAVSYVGANDGMLHAFDAETGEELFAYVPNAMMSSLPSISDSAAPYVSTVDGQLYAEDAYISGWKTLLTGGFRLGAQGVFLMDITNPSSITESSPSRAALWEFTDKNDADVGYIYGQPAIARMQNGKWAVIFGNGYNNTAVDSHVSGSGNAVLYIVDAETGGIIKKLDTGSGSIADPNGLAEPAIVDIDGDHIIDYIYAGDMKGGLWKFDVSKAATSTWQVANSGNALFQAESATGVKQPITVKPNVMNMKATLGGYLVLFGTGQYMTNGDAINAQASEQTFYAIWDDELGTRVNRSNMVNREIIAEQTISGKELRFSTSDADNPINFGTGTGQHRGWYLDLPNGVGDQERIISDAILRNGAIYFATYNPSLGTGVCESSASGSLMILNALTGGALTYETVLDENGNGLRDAQNRVPSGVVTDAGGPTGLVVTIYGNKETIRSGTNEGNMVSFDKQASPTAYGRQTYRKINTF